MSRKSTHRKCRFVAKSIPRKFRLGITSFFEDVDSSYFDFSKNVYFDSVNFSTFLNKTRLSYPNGGLVSSVPAIYHPELVKFIFVAFSEFRQKENEEGEKQISCLIAMLKYMLDLFKMKKNVSICAEKDVIRVILKEFSTILDAPSNSEASGYLLQLFSASSAYKVRVVK